MKRIALKRENFKTELEYLLALMDNQKKLSERIISLCRENQRVSKAIENLLFELKERSETKEVCNLLKSKYGEPQSN